MAVLIAALAVVMGLAAPVHGARLKDIADVVGVRSNQLTGIGLIVGLNGTGDGQQSLFTPQTVINFLKQRGILLTINPRQLQLKNVASVSLTAELQPFARQGTRMDVQVSSMGDAKSLQGGILLEAPLFAADGQVYAVSQGAVSLGGGFSARGAGASAQSGHPTAGIVPNGALVEKEVPVALGQNGVLMLALRRPDFTTAERVATAVNRQLRRRVARAVDPGTIEVALSGTSSQNAFDVATDIESVQVTPDTAARVVLNERTGTVIIGREVRVQPVAIAHGSLQVTVKTDFGVSQPGAFSAGQTVVVPDTTVNVQQGAKQNLIPLNPGVNLGQLVAGLNALGVTPQDLIAILQAIKQAGALEADLEIM
ncbi:MAG: flagellar basal body P-ring protein FlgI [Candidatus Binatia bacterium]